jgi:hypothetical protein
MIMMETRRQLYLQAYAISGITDQDHGVHGHAVRRVEHIRNVNGVYLNLYYILVRKWSANDKV